MTRKSIFAALAALCLPLSGWAVTLPLTGSSPSPSPMASPSASPAAVAAPVVISTLPATISAPGNYVLATSLTSNSAGAAITITASEVVLNLNGVSLNAGTAAQTVGVGIGILIEGGTSVVIQNGDIGSFGLAGVFMSTGTSTTSSNIKNVVRDVRFNGCLYAVLDVGGTANLVKDCLAQGGAIGFLEIGGNGNRVTNCTFEGQSTSGGLTAGFGVLSTGGGAGILVDNSFVVKAANVGLQLSGGDVFRFVSFAANGTNNVGGTNLMSN